MVKILSVDMSSENFHINGKGYVYRTTTGNNVRIGDIDEQGIYECALVNRPRDFVTFSGDSLLELGDLVNSWVERNERWVANQQFETQELSDELNR